MIFFCLVCQLLEKKKISVMEKIQAIKGVNQNSGSFHVILTFSSACPCKRYRGKHVILVTTHLVLCSFMVRASLSVQEVPGSMVNFFPRLSFDH